MKDESERSTGELPHQTLAPGALDDIGERRELRIAGIRLTGRRPASSTDPH